MNKSLLIVICDFLLLSMLSLANFDKPQDDVSKTKMEMEASQEQNYVDTQMIDLLKMSLDNERDKREALSNDISKLAKQAAQSQEQTQKQKQIIAARDKEIAQISKNKSELEAERKRILAQSQKLEEEKRHILAKNREQEKENKLILERTQRLEAEKERILAKSNELEKEKTHIIERSKELETRVKSSETRNATLEKEIVSTSHKLNEYAMERVKLERQIGDMREVDSTTRAKLQSVQRELKEHKSKLTELKKESDILKKEKNAIEAEKRDLSTRLEVATTQSKIYKENLEHVQALVDIEKTEKAQIRAHAQTLAEGVSELATSQKELNQDVKNLRPKTSSEIFNDIRSNFVTIKINYTQNSILGDSLSKQEIRSIPIDLNGKTLLLFNSEDTILSPAIKKYTPPKALSISVECRKYAFAPSYIYSIKQDPRILLIEVPLEFIKKENIKPIKLAKTLFDFNDCAVLNAEKFYYGQVPFRADFKNANFVQLDVSLFQSLFGTFSPSAGDIILTRSGDFMGFAIDNDAAVIFKDINQAYTLQLGSAYTPQKAKSFVEETARRLKAIPYRLKQ